MNRVLLADEPTAALDPHNAERLFELLLQLVAELGLSALIVSHDWALVERFGLPRWVPSTVKGKHALNPWHKRLLLLARLSLADLWHDRNVSLCMAASLVAVIAPLLLLFGLKHGVVSQLQQELLSDPRNLEVKMLSSGHFDQAWLQRLQARPEVGFAIGQTRSLNTQADLLGAHGRFADNVEVIPTRAGDPLLATDLSELAPDQVILSERAAERLDAKPVTPCACALPGA